MNHYNVQVKRWEKEIHAYEQLKQHKGIIKSLAREIHAYEKLPRTERTVKHIRGLKAIIHLHWDYRNKFLNIYMAA